MSSNRFNFYGFKFVDIIISMHPADMTIQMSYDVLDFMTTYGLILTGIGN